MIVPRETDDKLDRLQELVEAENTRQNLISASTLTAFRVRHIADSLQLATFCRDGPVVDIGSGAGFPGLVLAIVLDAEVHLVEPRRRRAEFLSCAAEELALENVVVHWCRVEAITGISPRSITARAVASLDRIFAMAERIADEETRWVLPKGRSARDELETARTTWHGEFELVQSSTDPNASIVVASRVRRRRGR